MKLCLLCQPFWVQDSPVARSALLSQQYSMWLRESSFIVPKLTGTGIRRPRRPIWTFSSVSLLLSSSSSSLHITAEITMNIKFSLCTHRRWWDCPCHGPQKPGQGVAMNLVWSSQDACIKGGEQEPHSKHSEHWVKKARKKEQTDGGKIFQATISEEEARKMEGRLSRCLPGPQNEHHQNIKSQKGHERRNRGRTQQTFWVAQLNPALDLFVQTPPADAWTQPNFEGFLCFANLEIQDRHDLQSFPNSFWGVQRTAKYLNQHFKLRTCFHLYAYII